MPEAFSHDEDPAPQAAVDKEDPANAIAVAVKAAEDKLVEDLRVLDLAEVSDFTDFFLVGSGSSERQVSAIANEVVSKLREEGVRAHHIEGLREGQWVLLDFGDFVVHVFEQGKREFYRLERLWSDAPDVTERFATSPG